MVVMVAIGLEATKARAQRGSDRPALAALAVPLARYNCAAAVVPALAAAALAECNGSLPADAPAATAVSLARCNCVVAVVSALVVALAVLPAHPRVRRSCRDSCADLVVQAAAFSGMDSAGCQSNYNLGPMAAPALAAAKDARWVALVRCDPANRNCRLVEPAADTDCQPPVAQSAQCAADCPGPRPVADCR